MKQENNEIKLQNLTPINNDIIFHNENNEIKLTKNGFFWNGKKVEDKHDVYERFNKWLNGVEKSKL